MLPPPLGLRLKVTQVHGELQVRWNTVTGAKSYLLEFAEIPTSGGGDLPWVQARLGGNLPWVQARLGGKLSYLAQGLIPGRRSAFRVAAVGGSTGSSAWSPVVERMAA